MVDVRELRKLMLVWGEYARTEMDRWGLQAWTFKWGYGKRRLGTCSLSGVISVSRMLLLLPEEERRHFKDTLAHEIAHALAHVHDRARGHGREWKRWCEKVGARPVRCAEPIEWRRFIKGDVEGGASAVGRRDSMYRYVLMVEGDPRPVHFYKVKPRFKRPLKYYSLRRRPETMGKLRLVEISKCTGLNNRFEDKS